MHHQIIINSGSDIYNKITTNTANLKMRFV